MTKLTNAAEKGKPDEEPRARVLLRTRRDELRKLVSPLRAAYAAELSELLARFELPAELQTGAPLAKAYAAELLRAAAQVVDDLDDEYVTDVACLGKAERRLELRMAAATAEQLAVWRTLMGVVVPVVGRFGVEALNGAIRVRALAADAGKAARPAGQMQCAFA